ncbi:hypothetical protein Xmau_00573 [Xenorhabdus mauleonii]|uniref:Uncharacterized protein n=1 Tax=Xenorhabdus mauleonii TaxID=351675 RepID=A0A1I3JE70_9GAMM|nr:hypothetical protein [Xenorhabdus mauleonii]PHM46176.1 hypothetical protein Xmau_00573 [Xenorhabdus mauleonii]SFI58258.1 hypothetical protein SAMN05421680_102168 [Xenorhabdus mauleonii]
MKLNEWLAKRVELTRKRESEGKLYGDQWVANKLKAYKQSEEDNDPHNKLNILLSHRSRMIGSSLSIRENKKPQIPANQNCVYFLIKVDEEYHLLNNPIEKRYTDKTNDAYKKNKAHGEYLFVITRGDPCNVRCAKTSRGGNYHGNDAVQGHTSISYREPVILAGTLNFTNGKLISWTNASGHYLPPPEQRYLLVPYIRKEILPDNKFRRVSFHTSF